MKLFEYLLIFIGIKLSVANMPFIISDTSGSVVDCINQYLQPMVTLAVDFSQDVIKCNSVTSKSATQVVNDTRATIVQNVDNMCSEIQVCKEKTSDSDFFNCFTSIGPQMFPTMFKTIYGSEILYDLKFGIMSDTKKAQALCIIDAEEKYMLNNIKNVEKINACVQSVVGIPTPLPIVVTTTTTTMSPTILTTQNTNPTTPLLTTTTASSTTTSKISTLTSSSQMPTSATTEDPTVKPTNDQSTIIQSSTSTTFKTTTHLPLTTEHHHTTNSASRLQRILQENI